MGHILPSPPPRQWRGRVTNFACAISKQGIYEITDTFDECIKYIRLKMDLLGPYNGRTVQGNMFDSMEIIDHFIFQ